MTEKHSALREKYAPITKAQLKVVVVDYASVLPGWQVCPEGVSLVRSSGPVQQMIWFQRMSSASYRPTHVLNTTVLPMPRMLNQVLDIRNREIPYRLHSQRVAETVAAMESQFSPGVRKDIDLMEVLDLCKIEARLSSTNDLVMLGILNAWLGHRTEALRCCERMQHATLPALAPVPEWETSMREFGQSLARAIKNDVEVEFLKMAIEGGLVK